MLDHPQTTPARCRCCSSRRASSGRRATPAARCSRRRATAMGGVAGALASHADRVIQDLGAQQRRSCARCCCAWSRRSARARSCRSTSCASYRARRRKCAADRSDGRRAPARRADARRRQRLDGRDRPRVADPELADAAALARRDAGRRGDHRSAAHRIAPVAAKGARRICCGAATPRRRRRSSAAATRASPDIEQAFLDESSSTSMVARASACS